MLYDELYEKFYRVIVNYVFRRLKDKYYSEEIASESFESNLLRIVVSSFPR